VKGSESRATVPVALLAAIRSLPEADGASVGLPDGSAVLSARTVAIALGAGTLVTLVAGLVPALRATAVPPISAVRGQFDAAFPQGESVVALLDTRSGGAAATASSQCCARSA
jgi:predicted lysophospholipase L1 biosynthesis ABC-type transport system permease subunit